PARRRVPAHVEGAGQTLRDHQRKGGRAGTASASNDRGGVEADCLEVRPDRISGSVASGSIPLTLCAWAEHPGSGFKAIKNHTMSFYVISGDFIEIIGIPHRSMDIDSFFR